MSSKYLISIAFLVGLVAVSVQAGDEYYARGTYYAGSGEPWDIDAGNQLHDDGLHGDDKAGDGIYGVYVKSDQPPGFHEWKIAKADWTENYPNNPMFPMSNAVLYTFFENETIHFRLDTNVATGGWLPVRHAVACSHHAPPDVVFELLGDGVELGEWTTGIIATLADDVWSVQVSICEPGTYAYKFRVVGTWDVCNIGIHYNMFRGGDATFTTLEPNRRISLEYNRIDGRVRAADLGPVETASETWGTLKQLYR